MLIQTCSTAYTSAPYVHDITLYPCREASTTLAENAWATGPGSQELDNNVHKNVLYRMLMHGLASPVTLMQLVGVTRGSDGTISVSTMLDAPAPSARARANSLSAVDEPQQRVRQRPLRWVCTYSEPSAGGGGGGGGGAGASQGATHSGVSAPSGLK